MLRILHGILAPLFLVALAHGQSDEPEFSGSPYQALFYSIHDLSLPSGARSETNRVRADNPYYLRLDLDPHLPRRFELTFELVALTGQQLADAPALSLYLPATYELFWDGAPLGRNGKLSAEGDELLVGNSYRSFPLPPPERAGSIHSLRIRGTHTFDPPNRHAFVVTLQTFSERLATAQKNALTYALYLAFALFGLYLLAYAIFDRSRIQYLMLGLTCFVFGLYAVNKLLYYQLNVPYPYLDWTVRFAIGIDAALSLLAPATLLCTLRFRRGYAYAASLIPAVIAAAHPTLTLIAATAYTCVGIALLALAQKRRYAPHALAISTILLLNYQVPYFQQRPTIGLGILAAFLLVSIINLQRLESKRRNEAQLQNARLQLELLKSKIEPHFVLNSLTSAIEWIETNPKEGVNLIQALAREFELLSDISDKKLIPLGLEIESCQSYLQIMGYRKKARYELRLAGVDPNTEIPPAVIRNLLENAITHNVYSQDSIRFDLRIETLPSGRRLVFRAPLSGPQPAVDRVKDGTGLKYIKARLAESYANWSFEHGPATGVWQTTISLP